MLVGVAVLRAADAPEVVAPAGLDAKLKTDYGYGVFTAGMQYYIDKDMKYARAAFQLARESNPALGRAPICEAEALCELKDYAEAVKCYEMGLKLEPDFSLGYYNLACAQSLLGEKAKALAAIEEALKLGYDRFDHLEKDDDLKAARVGPEFAALLEKYKKSPVEKTAVQKYILLKTPDEKAEMLEAIAGSPLTEPGKGTATKDLWKPVADKALLEGDGQLRIGGLKLYRLFGSDEEKLDVMVQALFDNNGYVNKFGGTVLVEMGDKALPYLDAIRDSKFGTPEGQNSPKFYEKQIRQLIKKKLPAAN